MESESMKMWTTDVLCNRILTRYWPVEEDDKLEFVDSLKEACESIIKLFHEGSTMFASFFVPSNGHMTINRQSEHIDFLLRIVATALFIRVCTGLEANFFYKRGKREKSSFVYVLDLLELLQGKQDNSWKLALNEICSVTLKYMLCDLRVKKGLATKEEQADILSQYEPFLSNRDLSVCYRILREELEPKYFDYEKYAKIIFNQVRSLNGELKKPYLETLIDEMNQSAATPDEDLPDLSEEYNELLNTCAESMDEDIPEEIWTEELDNNLIEGVNQYGVENWVKILRKIDFPPYVTTLGLKSHCKELASQGVINLSESAVDILDDLFDASSSEDEETDSEDSSESIPEIQSPEIGNPSPDEASSQPRKKHKRSIIF